MDFILPPWAITREGVLTGQYFSNAPCAAATALSEHGGMRHAEFGDYSNVECQPISKMHTEMYDRERHFWFRSPVYYDWLELQRKRSGRVAASC